jgi:hypothetical protein
MKDTILGTDPVRKIVSSGFKLKASESLGQISRDVYGRPDYWLLVGAVNLDQGYYDFRKASADTVIPGGKFIEIWKVSRDYGQTEKTIIQLSGPAIAQGNEELLQLAKTGAPPDIPALQDAYKAREMDLEYGEAQIGDLQTLREVAIKYYGDAKSWPILVWTNPDSLAGTTDTSPIPRNTDLYVLHFLPWEHPAARRDGPHLHVTEIEAAKLPDAMTQGRNAMIRDLRIGPGPCIKRVRGRLDEIIPVVPRSLVIFFPFFDHIPIKAEKPCFNIALRNEPGDLLTVHAD